MRERSVGHEIGTAPLRPIIAGEEQRRQQTHYGPIVAQLSTGITRRPTRKLTLPTESELETEEATPPGLADVAGKPESTISRRLSQGYTKIYFPRDFQLGRSSKPRLLRSSLWPTEGTTGSECFLGRSCVRIFYGDHFCAEPKREPVSTQWCSEEVDQVEQTFKRFISITPLSRRAEEKTNGL